MIKKKIGKYRILSWLGGGQFADVFLALDTITKAKFALKVSRETKEVDEGLLKEAQLLVSLEHPNIVRFYSADIIEGRLILALEYVKGASLREVIRKESPLTPQEVHPLFFQMKDALRYAHSMGVLHRDIKPENILLTKENRIKITDFGLAVLLSRKSLRASIAGTPLYMPPESWKGLFTKASDQWSCAAVIYELLSGHPPFFGDTLEDLRKLIRKGKISKIPKVSPEVHETIERALSPKPAERFESIEEFFNAYEKAIYILTPKVTPKSKRKRLPRSLKGLSEEQIDAIKNGDGIVLIIGSTGTGKTTTLTSRIAYLIEKKADPGKILAVTFTGKGVAEIKEKLRRFFDVSLLKDLWVETYHSLAMRILSRGAERLGFPEEINIIDREGQMMIFKKVIGIKGIRKINAIMREIERAKAGLISPKTYLLNSSGEWSKTVGKAYESYQRILKEKGLMDFGDLLFYANLLLKRHRDLKDHFSLHFDYILVDEFQDINYAQFHLIRRLASRNKNLFVTGDDDQAIYGFRGASSSYFLELKRFFPKLKEFRLTRNFRTPTSIMNLSQNLISHNRKRIKKAVVALKKDTGGEIRLIKAKDEIDEARTIASKILSLHGEGISFEHIAVFLRVHSQSFPFEKEFASKGIPFKSVSVGFYDREEIRALISYLKILAGDTSRDNVYLVLKRFLDLQEKEADSFASKIAGKRRLRFPKDFSERKRKQILNFRSHLKNIGDIVKSQSPREILESFLETSGYMKKLEKKDQSASKLNERESIEEFLELTQDFGPGELNSLLNRITFLKESGFVSSPEAGVFLSTIHTAKGLEFPIVFVPGLLEGVCPLFKAISDPDELEEERRLLYVAMTRAQEKLFLSFPRKRFGRFFEPSRFLMELFEEPQKI